MLYASILPFLFRTQYFRLAPNPAFLPKTSMEVALSSDLEITAFYPEPPTPSPLERGFHLMCLVRVSRIYLRRTKYTRGPNRFLSTEMREGPITLYQINE